MYNIHQTTVSVFSLYALFDSSLLGITTGKDKIYVFFMCLLVFLRYSASFHTCFEFSPVTLLSLGESHPSYFIWQGTLVLWRNSLIVIKSLFDCVIKMKFKGNTRKDSFEKMWNIQKEINYKLNWLKLIHYLM
jgi:hypothetical protein